MKILLFFRDWLMPILSFTPKDFISAISDLPGHFCWCQNWITKFSKIGRLCVSTTVVRSCHYNQILAHKGIHVNDTPSWGVIEFSDNPSNVECAQHLASRGVTPNELADINQYVFGWLEAIQQGEKDV